MRVALIETVPDQVHRHHRAEVFPFVLGWIRALGGEGVWWAYAVPPERMHVGGERYVVALSDAGSADLQRRLAEYRPEAVVFHNRPAEALLAAVHQAAPAARVVDLTALGTADLRTADLAGAFGVEAAPESGFLADDVLPAFARELTDANPALLAQPVRLMGRMLCLYRDPVREAAPYRGLELPVASFQRGCSFCMRGVQTETGGYHTKPLELAFRQISAHQAAYADSTERFTYLLEEGALSRQLGPALEEAVRRRLRPSTFLVMPRADELLAQRDRLVRGLERAAPQGHALRLLSMGVENFSPAENERFNKGLTADQVFAAAELIDALAKRFPGAVEAEDFAGILFTPWTTPADLRLNAAASRRLPRCWLHRVMGTRLQLFPGSAVAELATHDGLIATTAAGGDVAAVCLSHPDQQELPWRFAHPLMPRLHQLLIRLDPIHFAVTTGEDDLVKELRALRALLPPALAEDYVGICTSVIDAVEALGAGAPPRQLFEWIAQRHGTELMSPQARAQPGSKHASTPGPHPAHPAELRILFSDPITHAARYVFRAAEMVGNAPAFRHVHRTRITYDRCTRDATFDPCAALVVAAAQRLPSPPHASQAGRWATLLGVLVEHSGLSEQVTVSVQAVGGEGHPH